MNTGYEAFAAARLREVVERQAAPTEALDEDATKRYVTQLKGCFGSTCSYHVYEAHLAGQRLVVGRQAASAVSDAERQRAPRAIIGRDTLPLTQPCPHCYQAIDVGTDQVAVRSAFLPSQPKPDEPARGVLGIAELVDDVYRIGWMDRRDGRQFKPRGSNEYKDAVAAPYAAPQPPASEPVRGVSEARSLKLWCETCEGAGVFDATLGGDAQMAGTDQKCPDCEGKGYLMTKVSEPDRVKLLEAALVSIRKKIDQLDSGDAYEIDRIAVKSLSGDAP
jgi:hypothetical protein